MVHTIVPEKAITGGRILDSPAQVWSDVPTVGEEAPEAEDRVPCIQRLLPFP